MRTINKIWDHVIHILKLFLKKRDESLVSFVDIFYIIRTNLSRLKQRIEIREKI